MLDLWGADTGRDSLRRDRYDTDVPNPRNAGRKMTDSTTPARMTIGSLAQATGVPANTLRTWQKRYGFPHSERTAGGHRLYRPEVIPQVKLAQQALAAGHRPGQVLTLPIEEIRALVAASRPTEPVLDGLIAATMALDAKALDRAFAVEISRRGSLDFFESLAIPFLHALGDRWVSGELEVFQEHFASERLIAFLSRHWYAAAAGSRGHAVLATLEGEEHVLGLHMVATVLTQVGWNPIYLGRSTPTADIEAAVRQVGARVVAISSSVHADPTHRDEQLRQLRRDLPDEVQILCGGGGMGTVDGVRSFHTLREISEWADRSQ